VIRNFGCCVCVRVFVVDVVRVCVRERAREGFSGVMRLYFYVWVCVWVCVGVFVGGCGGVCAFSCGCV